MCHNPYTLPTPQPQPQSAPVGYFDTESGLWWTELLLLLLPGMRRTQSQPDTPAQVTAAAAATTVRTTKGRRRRRRLAPTFTRIRDLGLSQDCSSASSYTYTHSGFKTTLWRRRRRRNNSRRIPIHRKYNCSQVPTRAWAKRPREKERGENSRGKLRNSRQRISGEAEKRDSAVCVVCAGRWWRWWQKGAIRS